MGDRLKYCPHASVLRTILKAIHERPDLRTWFFGEHYGLPDAGAPYKFPPGKLERRAKMRILGNVDQAHQPRLVPRWVVPCAPRRVQHRTIAGLHSL